MNTPNLDLEQINITDPIDVMRQKTNSNMQKVDTKYGELADTLLNKTGKATLEEAVDYLDNLTDTYDATAIANDIKSGKIAYSKGNKLIGTFVEAYTNAKIKSLIDRTTTSFTLPTGVTTIGDSCFRSCAGLISITIPTTVTSIGTLAFRYCIGLTTITIPDSVTSIGDYAFDGCTNITTIKMLSTTPPTIGSNTFNNMTALTRIEVPSASLSVYQSATYWSSKSSLMVGV